MTSGSHRRYFFGTAPLGMIIAFLVALGYSVATCMVSFDETSIHHHFLGTAQSEAYTLGAESASAVYLLRNDSVSLNNALLEVRAEEWSIRHNFGELAAVDFIKGFEDKITELSDSLATILF